MDFGPPFSAACGWSLVPSAYEPINEMAKATADAPWLGRVACHVADRDREEEREKREETRSGKERWRGGRFRALRVLKRPVNGLRFAS